LPAASNVYPPEHAELQRQIGERGCLISENAPGFAPRAQDFPRRNRIISGVALGVLIVEAARRSGTLITARTAAEQGREVFAIPGHPLDPRAEGTNRLLKTGATMATEPEDVISTLAPMLREPLARDARTVEEPPAAGSDGRPTAQVPEVGAQDRARLLAALGPAPVDIDELARATGLPARALQIALIRLALAGASGGTGISSFPCPGGRGETPSIRLGPDLRRPLNFHCDGSEGSDPPSQPSLPARRRRGPRGRPARDPGQRPVVGLRRHDLELLHHGGDVVELLVRGAERQGRKLRPARARALPVRTDAAIPTVLNMHTLGPPAKLPSSGHMSKLRDLTKRN
jgi:hypothetical protein